MQNASRLVGIFSFFGLLAAGVLIVGCDSGGNSSGNSGGDGDPSVSNTSSVMVAFGSNSSSSSIEAPSEKTAKASGDLTVTFVYQNNSESNCTLSETDSGINTSDYNEPFDPTSISGNCDDPANFDGVKAAFTPGGSSTVSGLTLRILDGEGQELVSADGSNGGLSASATASDDVTFPSDGDGSDDTDDTTAPNAPSGLSASAGDGTVDLNWDAVSASDPSGYNVYRSTSSISDISGMSSINGSLLSGTSYTDSGTNNGSTYYYVVTAVDGSGNESAASNEVTATPSSDASGSTRIAFEKDRVGSSSDDIYTIRPDGSGLKQITNDGADDSTPTWSPDGNRIAFRSDRDGDSSDDIYTIQPDGSGLKQVTDGVGGSAPAWSPDGSRIAFERRSDIYTIRPDGSGLKQITNDSASDNNPAWSPDGSRIAFERDFAEIYTIRPDGSGLKQVTDGVGDRAPAWSPDGSRILFHSGRGENFSDDIYTIQPDGSGLKQVTNNANADYFHPAWSPDGRRIVFYNSNLTIYTIHPDGSGLKQITSNGAFPAWSPSQ
jgi:TolB protein